MRLLACFLLLLSLGAAPATRPASRPATLPGGWQKETIEPDRAAQLLGQLETGDAIRRRDALFNLSNDSHVQAPSQFRQPLIRALRDPDPVARSLAAKGLLFHQGNWTTQEDAIAAVKVLAEAIAQDDLTVRREALECFDDAGPVARHAADALVRAVATMPEPKAWDYDDEALDCWDELIDQLEDLDASAADAVVPGLKELLASERRMVAITAHIALSRLRPEQIPSPPPVKRFLPGLVRQLGEGDALQRYLTTLVLSRIGETAAEAMPDIVAFIARPPQRDWVGPEIQGLSTIARSFGKPAMPELLRIIEHGEEREACVAATLIGNAEQLYQEALPQLIRLAGASNGKLRATLISAIASVGQKKAEVTDLLLGYLNHQDPLVRAAAAGGLHEQESTPRVLDALRRAARDSDEEVRKSAEFSLSWLALPEGRQASTMPAH